MIEIKKISVETLRTTFSSLLRMHYSEVDMRNKSMLLNPDWDIYKIMEASKQGNMVGVFEDGYPIGYASCIIQPSLKCKGTKELIVDSFYIIPEVRKAGVGKELLLFCRDLAKEEGCSIWSTSTKSKYSNKLMESLGLTHTENLHQEVLL